jgi:uncharacterized protein YjdB
MTDPRDLTYPTVGQRVGTALRDAAVDPEAGDFLAPINAGEDGDLGDPHGPTVISTEIHGSQGVHPITPGAVSGTAATQEAAEKAHMADFQNSQIESLSVTPATTTKAAAATQQLVATATLVDGVTTEVVTASTTWTTSDATKATVDAAGLVTAVATGEATVTGTYLGKTDTCVVTVS